MDEFFKKYRDHRNQFIFRYNKLLPNGFQLTLEEWTKLWLDSGKWKQRGRRPEEYCLTRIDSTKPLTLDNAQIITNIVRVKQTNLGKPKSESTKEKMSKASIGRPKSEEHKKAMSEAQKRRAEEIRKLKEQCNK